MSDQILAGGRPITVPGCVVKTWYETKLGLPGHGRRTETRAVGWHWTGGENAGGVLRDVIGDRHLSVQFSIDQAGVIFQYADADDRCSHMNEANGWCVGMEIVNRADGRPTVGPGRWPREVYDETVHGHTFKCTAFYPAQVIAVKTLTQALCAHYGLPFARPYPGNTSVLTHDQLAAFRGVIGHYEVNPSKTDPGTRLFRECGI